MRTSVFISLILHIAILAYALVGFAAPRDFKPKEIKSLPVEILTPSEFTKLTAGDKKAKAEKPAPVKKKDAPKKAKKKLKKRKTKAVHAPTAKEPEKIAVKPKTKDKKAEAIKKKKAEKPKPKKKKKAEKPKPKKQKPKTKKVKAKKKKQFDTDELAALLNKIPDSGAPDEPKSKPKPKKKPAKKTKGQGGIDQRLAASIGAQVRRRIENECWTVPVGGRDVDDLVVKIRFKLDKGGNLQGQPKILNAMNGPAARAVSESAKRAIWACQPYYEFTSRLPKNYQDWKEVTMNFDMRVMYGN